MSSVVTSKTDMSFGRPFASWKNFQISRTSLALIHTSSASSRIAASSYVSPACTWPPADIVQ